MASTTEQPVDQTDFYHLRLWKNSSPIDAVDSMETCLALTSPKGADRAYEIGVKLSVSIRRQMIAVKEKR
jgi:hypothetical protein